MLKYLSILIIPLLIFACNGNETPDQIPPLRNDSPQQVESKVDITHKTNDVVESKIPKDTTTKIEIKEQKLQDQSTEPQDTTHLVQQQKVTEYKKTIYSRNSDFNYDSKTDLILFYVITTETDTITYYSLYLNMNNEMRNTITYRFKERIAKIDKFEIYTDSTFIVYARNKETNQKFTKKFKFIDNHTVLELY